MAMSTQVVVMIKSCCCLLWLLSIVHSVSRENFKTCDQSGFCKRHRSLKSGESPYVVVMDSLQIIDKHLQVELLNTENNVRLSLQLFGLEHNSARLKIDELKPTRSRYEIPMGDVLVDEPKQQQLKIIDKNQDTVTLSHGANRIVLSSKPFRLDVFNDGDHIMGLNAQGLLKFEHYRIKEEPPAEQKVEKPEDENNDAEQNAEEKKEEETAKEEEAGLWEESFKGFTDSKPYGPSSVGLDISFPGVENVYGIPEHAESLALKSTKDTDPYRLFNLDVFEYELYNPMALYGAVPVMLAHSEKRTLGIYWNNAAETWVDIRSTTADKTFFTKVADMVQGNADMPQTDTHWISESGVIDLFLMFGPTPRNVFKQYAVLTGTTPLPPLFAIAYHQSRWNYNDEVDVKNVDASFDKFDMPCDVIWLDIEHTDGKRYFTWDKDKFQHPVDMINNVASKGRKIVTIVDPHLKKDDNYQVYADAKSRNILVKNKDNGEYDGWCWPGSSAWPDFTDPAIRKWWAEKFHYNSYLGSSPDLFIWNDMNEPSVFNGPEITFHKDVKHANERENRDVHNIYGMYVHQATYEGIKLRSNNEQRPFVLSRAFFAGSQRFGAVWTGDNMGEWSHLKISNPMILSLNLVGITLSGADVGGFFRNPDSELLARWFQAGAYQPFFRAHAHLDTKRREPYLLPDNLRESTRNVIAARYSYLPFWYTLFYIGEKDGGPIMSPLWVDYPQDKSTFTIDDEYLIGSDLLVKPITEAGVTGTNVYFPGKNNIWYDVETYQTYQGASTTYVNAPMEKIPVYQRGGSIVPRKMRLRRSSGLMHNDPFTLIICLDKNREASGQLYVDDYSSHRYHQGEFIFRKFEFKNNKLTSSNAAHSSKYSTKEWLEKVVIVGYPQKPSSISIVSSSGMVSLSSSYDAASKSLVIRKPGNNIGEDFTINIQ